MCTQQTGENKPTDPKGRLLSEGEAQCVQGQVRPRGYGARSQICFLLPRARFVRLRPDNLIATTADGEFRVFRVRALGPWEV